MTLAKQMAKRVYSGLLNAVAEPQILVSPWHAWFDQQLPSRVDKAAFAVCWQRLITQALVIAPGITHADIADSLKRCFKHMGVGCRVQPLRWHIYGVFTFGEQDSQIYDIHYEEQTNGKR